MKVYKFILSALLTGLLCSCQNGEIIDTTPQTEYLIEFDTSGETNIPSQKVKHGNRAIDPLINPEKTGYTFDYWYYLDVDGQEKKWQFTIAVTQNYKLIAHYIPNTYKIYFENNESSIQNSSVKDFISCYYDQEIILSKTYSPVTGKTFLGWSLSPLAQSVDYPINSIIKNLTDKNEAEITLYAVWEVNIFHIITWEVGGGKNSSFNPTKFLESQSITLYNPEWEGYEFGGWFKNADFSGKSVTGWASGECTEDITLYAKWIPYTFTVTLHDRDNENTFSIDYGSYLNDYEVPFEDGASFSGFYDQKYGLGNQYINASGKGIRNYDVVGDLELYSCWDYLIEYVVPAEYQERGQKPNNSSYTGAREITLQDFICKEGYFFEGWLDENGALIKTIPTGSFGKKTFTCKGVKIINYTITFEKNGGEWDSAGGYYPPETYSYFSDTIYLPSKFDIKRSGYVFKGWHKESDFSDEVIIFIENKSSGDINLYAEWEEE